MLVRRVASLCCTLALLLPFAVRSAAPDREAIAADERSLKEKGIATDGTGLLAYFKARTLTAEDFERLTANIRKLGDNDFETREKASHDLVAAGRPAVQLLTAALNDPDLEIVRRARQCLDEISANQTMQIMSAAARVLAERRPEGAAAALLAYLPSNDEDAVEEAVFAALRQVGLRDGKPDPAVTAALKDKVALRRAAAAHVQGRAAAAEDRRPVTRLLADAEDRRPVTRLLADADARVRFEAAAALARSGDKAAVHVLIALLTDAPDQLGWQAEDLLARIAGEDVPASGLGSTKQEQRKARDAWEAWWKEKGDKVDLAKLKNEEPFLGLTLVTEYDGHANGGRVYELGKDGKERWAISGLLGPNDAQLLPGGRVLIAERNGGRVTERDRKGNILWQHSDSQSPIACQRLPGGRTLIATFGELYELAPGPGGKKLHSLPGSFRHAIQLRNGHTLYVTSNGDVVELDSDWKQLRKARPEEFAGGAGYWASVELLPNGRLLVALGGQGHVVEMDWTGKVHRKLAQANCVFATRLPNGNTLISNFENHYLVEMDRNGHEVAKTSLDRGRVFTVRRY